MLFIHSKEDTSVPFYQGKDVFDNATGPKELWVYKGKHLASANNLTDEFIQKINNLIQ